MLITIIYHYCSEINSSTSDTENSHVAELTVEMFRIRSASVVAYLPAHVVTTLSSTPHRYYESKIPNVKLFYSAVFFGLLKPLYNLHYIIVYTDNTAN